MVVTSGGDTLSFLFHVWASFLEDVDLCVYHRAPPPPEFCNHTDGTKHTKLTFSP